jgi:hypothetical protein
MWNGTVESIHIASAARQDTLADRRSQQLPRRPDRIAATAVGRVASTTRRRNLVNRNLGAGCSSNR